MDDHPMLIDFSQLSAGRQSHETLREIKNELIGNEKQAYYDKGLLETIMSLVSAETDPLILYECLVILNSFLIKFPKAHDTFVTYKDELVTKLQAIFKQTKS